MSSKRRRARRLPARMTIVLLLVTLVIFNGTGVFLYVRTKRSMEEQLGQDLLLLAGWGVSEMRRNLFEPEDIPWIDPTAARDPEYRQLLRQMQSFVEAHDLERLLLYDARLRVKLDTAEQLAINAENPFTVVDQWWIDAALEGTQTATIDYRVGDNRFMRAYVPLTSAAADGASPEVLGLLCVEGQRRYFAPLHALRRLMLLLSATVSGALVAIALVAHGALRRFVRLEETVAHADRLQTLGTLAAGMAHEIRNPLGIMRITAETLRQELRGPGGAVNPDLDQLCQDILEEVDRIHALIGRFLSFARPGDRMPEEPARLGEVVPHAVRLVSKAVPDRRITFELTRDEALDGALTPLPAASLEQVLFNILRNAHESMEAAGRTGTIQVRVSAADGGRAATIAVTDQGVGMTAAQVRRAGEPFVSTKPDGTGLGLSITKNLLASVQGRLEITSRPGEGTTVAATVPILRDNSGHPEEARGAENPREVT